MSKYKIIFCIFSLIVEETVGTAQPRGQEHGPRGSRGRAVRIYMWAGAVPCTRRQIVDHRRIRSIHKKSIENVDHYLSF